MRDLINSQGHRIQSLTKREIALLNGDLVYRRMAQCAYSHESKNLVITRTNVCYYCWLLNLPIKDRLLPANAAIITFKNDFMTRRKPVIIFEMQGNRRILNISHELPKIPPPESDSSHD